MASYNNHQKLDPSIARSQDAGSSHCWPQSEIESISTSTLHHKVVGGMPLSTTFKSHPKRVLYIVLMIPAILLVGYNLIIVGALASMPYFDFIYGERHPDPMSSLGVTFFIPAAWLGLWNGLGALGTMFGAGFAGWIHDRFGRRGSMRTGATISALGIGIIYASAFQPTVGLRRIVFLTGKSTVGFATGNIAATTQTYLSEITPTSLHGPVSAFFPAIVLTGQIVGARIVFQEVYVVADWGFKTCMLSMFPFAGAVLLISFIMPESPTWLMRLGLPVAARKAIQHLERADVDVGELIYDLSVVLDREKAECGPNDSVSLAQCFKGVDRRRTWIVILCNTMTNMFGVTFLNTATYFYELMGMEAGTAIKLLEAGIGVGIAANFISVWSMTKFSRRSLMIGTFLVIAALWLAIAITGFFPTTSVLNYVSAGAMMGVIFVSGLGVWPTSVAVSSEASSLRLRGKTQSIGWVCQNLTSGAMGIILPYIYTPNQGNSGEKIGFLFFGTSVLGAVLAWLYVPEMKGRTATEINAMFNARISTRGFSRWQPDTSVQEEVVKEGPMGNFF